MADFIEYPLDSGGTVLVAVISVPVDGPVTRGWGDDRQVRVLERANQTFQTAVEKLRPAADAVLASLSGMASSPDEIAVEFCVQLTAEAGVCIATLGSAANFKITLTWKP